MTPALFTTVSLICVPTAEMETAGMLYPSTLIVSLISFTLLPLRKKFAEYDSFSSKLLASASDASNLNSALNSYRSGVVAPPGIVVIAPMPLSLLIAPASAVSAQTPLERFTLIPVPR